MFNTLLIANRGEIAVRVARTARHLGIKVVAVYSDADAEALHVRFADEAVRLGPAAATESYLRIDAVLEAAAQTGAEAIHPGYGFLSENADFAEAVAGAGITFVGPSAAAIRAMGRKDEAKAIMEAAGVPVTPGYRGDDQSLATLKAAAGEVGYPVLIKAVAGGGGKGMRKVEKAGGFKAALESAQRESAKAFGDDRVLIEKFISGPRHIEVQIFGDSHGNVVHFFERDCSLQRRHQKVIEEAPAPGMTEEVRAAMTSAAVEAARAVDYVNAGTVEFIVDGSSALRPDGFFFMEMNTRLQVEHPVTEMITGRDLVALQLEVAAGGTLPAQDAITMDGHAMEARIYAEDPATGFLPSAGRLALFRFGDLDATMVTARDTGDRPVCVTASRLDAGLDPLDGVVTPFYDPMIAKVIVKGQDREAARADLARRLQHEATVAGPATNLGFIARCLEDGDFAAGRLDTGLIERAGEALITPSLTDDQACVLYAAALSPLSHRWTQADAGEAGPAEPWDAGDGFRLNAPARAWRTAALNGRVFGAATAADGDAAVVTIGTDASTVTGADQPGGAWDFAIDGEARARGVRCARGTDGSIVLTHQGDVWRFIAPDFDAAVEALEAGDDVLAPMPGKIVSVAAQAGARIAKGASLVVLEAMKMEHSLHAPRDGTVAQVLTEPGAQVTEGAVLVRLEDEPGA